MKQISFALIFLAFSSVASSQVWIPLATSEADEIVMTIHEHDSLLYVAGQFDTIDNVASNNIAYWDGTQFHPVSVSFWHSSYTRLYKMLTVNNNLIICGLFTTVNGDTVNNIVTYDGTNWTPLGNGLSPGMVEDIVLFNNELYAAGNIYFNGTRCYAAKWNGTDWVRVGSEVADSYASVIGVFNNELYVGGYFNEGIRKWNGTSWVSVAGGTGPDNTYCCAVHSLEIYNNELHVGGQFGQLGGIYVPNIGKWNGTNWSALSTGGQFVPLVYAMMSFGTELFLGGGILQLVIPTIGKYDGTNYYPLGEIGARDFEAYDSELYVAAGLNVYKYCADSADVSCTSFNCSISILGGDTADVNQPATYYTTHGAAGTWSVSNGTILSGQGTDTVQIDWGAIGQGTVEVAIPGCPLFSKTISLIRARRIRGVVIQFPPISLPGQH